ncbi:MlaD family protein [Nocardia sp. NPDC006630]|uniref:MlaD family protein n=1 Tax=Nocardia sp. NPDC006630 TaxID=3157181 RepID=UPI0033A76691
MPGVQVSRGGAIKTGAVLLTLAVVLAGGWALRPAPGSADGLRIALHTEHIGDGVVDGTQVMLDGVTVGEVVGIAPDEQGTQRITVQLNKSQLAGLDSSLRLDYAPSNLFGISELELRRGTGGSPLLPDTVIDLTGPRSSLIYDATMSNLMRNLTEVTTDVLTPELTTTLTQLATDVGAFTPLAQAIVVLGRTVADTRTVAPSELLGGYGTALTGGARFADALFKVMNEVYHIDVLRTDRGRFDATIAMVVDQLFPGLQNTLYRASDEFSGYTAMLAPMLSAAARTVPTPERSGADLRALLDRLRAALPDTPNGPVLDVDVDLGLVPVLGATPGGAR